MSSALAWRYCGCTRRHATDNCSRVAVRRAHADHRAAATAQFCTELPRSSLRDPHFFPDAALFFPVVKRFAVDLVNGSLRCCHPAGLSGHEEIDVVNCAVRTFHIDTRKILAAAQ